MQTGNALEVFWVVVGSALACGTALYLWYLAKDKPMARLIIVALWLVFLAMSIILGPPWVLVMGGATVLMALWIFAMIQWPWWFR